MKHCIIVTVYNKLGLTKRCLESLASTTDFKNNLLCVVDDASSDPARVYLRRFKAKHPEVVLFRNRKNIGKPRCLNLVLKKFPRMDYYTIIDNDVTVKTKNWLDILRQAHRDWNNQAILGAYTYMTGYPFVKNGRHYLDPWPFWNLAGCFFSFSKKVFNKVGYFFDKSCRSEDADYCRRAYLAGFRWFYLKDIKATISGYKAAGERKRLDKRFRMEQKIRRRWSDYVMKTHKIYYKPIY